MDESPNQTLDATRGGLVGLDQKPTGFVGRLRGAMLRRTMDPRPELDYGQTRSPGRSTRLSAAMISYVVAVVLPTLASSTYLAFFAADQYVTEAQFAVREGALGSSNSDDGNEKKGPGGATGSVGSGSSLTGGGLLALATQDAYVVSHYIRSKTVLSDLTNSIDLREIYRRPEADFWAKLNDHANADQLLTYWNNMVSTYVDGPSGIVTLKVAAFRREDTVAVAQALLDRSEKLINDISERARHDAVARAEEEVKSTSSGVESALADLRVYRDKEHFIDPTSAATDTMKLLHDQMTTKIDLESQLFVALREMAPDAPSVRVLTKQIGSVDVQIADLKSKLTSASKDAPTIASAMGEFEQLETKRDLAEKLYMIAEEALERARIKAEEQILYITVFEPPALPDEREYPLRLGYSVLIFISLSVLWGIAALIAAAVDDHR